MKRDFALPTAISILSGLLLACMAGKTDNFESIYVEGESIQRLSVLTSRMDMCADPNVGRTGALLVFTCRVGENWDLYMKRSLHGDALQRLGGHAAHDIEPSLSPNGQNVVFASNRSGNFDLFTMSTGGGTAVRQVTDSPDDDRCPDWSPDGMKIAFHRVSSFDDQPYIWIRELDTNALVQLGPGRCPRFSRDGQQLAYFRAADSTDGWFSVWTVDTSGRNNTQVAGGSDWGAVDVTWSPQGQHLMFASACSQES
jgi:TolB protein